MGRKASRPATGRILFIYKFLVKPLFKLTSIEHVIIGSKHTVETMSTMQARQTRPRSQFGQIRGLGLAAAAGVSHTIGYGRHLPCWWLV